MSVFKLIKDCLGKLKGEDVNMTDQRACLLMRSGYVAEEPAIIEKFKKKAAADKKAAFDKKAAADKKAAEDKTAADKIEADKKAKADQETADNTNASGKETAVNK